jgi:hypothetical protein
MPGSPAKFRRHFGGIKLLSSLGSKSKPSKKPTRSRQQGELILEDSTLRNRSSFTQDMRETHVYARHWMFRHFRMLAGCLNNCAMLLFVSHIAHGRQQTYVITSAHLTCGAGSNVVEEILFDWESRVSSGSAQRHICHHVDRR